MEFEAKRAVAVYATVWGGGGLAEVRELGIWGDG